MDTRAESSPNSDLPASDASASKELPATIEGGWESRTLSVLEHRNRGLALLACAALLLAVGWTVWQKTVGSKPEGMPAPFVLDLNRANEAELNLLPGIGLKSVEAIVAYRKAHGGFTSVDELTRIPGIKEGRLRALRPYVTVAPAIPMPDRTHR